jgi:excisionase family DNA binding protein
MMIFPMNENYRETYLTIEETADYLKLSVDTIRRYILNEEIPFHKIKKVIRLRLSEIEKWIENKCVMTCEFSSGLQVTDCDTQESDTTGICEDAL